MNISVHINNIDQSSYLTNCSNIPIVKRNRDWSPIFGGFTCSISSNATTEPMKDDRVRVVVEGSEVYYGYVSRKEFNRDTSTWDLEITHWLMKLEQYKISYADLHTELIKKAVSSTATWNTCTVDHTNDEVNFTAHGLSNGDKILFKNESGNMPGGLSQYHIYYVKSVTANSFKLYSSYAEYMTGSAGLTNDQKVNITSAGTGTLQFTTDILFDKYNDWSFFRDISCGGVGTSSDVMQSYLRPGDNKFPIVAYWSSGFNASLIEFDTDGTLPSPLVRNRAYIAASHNADDGFVLYNNQADYESNTKIDLTNTGTGNHYYAVLKQYIETSYNWPLIYPNAVVQLKHLIETIFSLVFIELDTTLIDDIIFYRYTTEFQSYGWEEIYFREDMLYSMGQSEPLHHSLCKVDQMFNCVEFIQEIFARLGIAIKFQDYDPDILTYSYKLYPQKRTSVGVIDPENESQFTINTAPRTVFNEAVIDTDNGGWLISRIFGAFENLYGLGLCFFYNDQHRNLNVSLAESAVSSANGQYNGIPIEESEGAGLNNISLPNHTIFFLKDLFETNGLYNVYMLRDGFLGKEFYDYGYTVIPYSPIINAKYALKQHNQVEYETNQALDQDIWTVREISLDLRNDRVKIIQELIEV